MTDYFPTYLAAGTAGTVPGVEKTEAGVVGTGADANPAGAGARWTGA